MPRLNLKNLVRFLIYFVCQSGLIYQLFLTTQIYLQYDTVTKIEYYNMYPKELPSIVFCMPRLFPKKAIDFYEKKYSEFDKKVFDKFFTENDFLECNDFDLCDVRKLLLNSVQFFNKTIYFQSGIGPEGIFTRFIMDGKTLHYPKSTGVENILQLTLKQFLALRFKRCIQINANYESSKPKDVQPISQNSFLKLSLNDIYYPNDTAVIQMYSSNEMPSGRAMSQIHVQVTKDFFEMMFHSITVERLPPPFKTDCYDYKIGKTGDQSQMDCVARCSFQLLLPKQPLYFFKLVQYAPDSQEWRYYMSKEYFESGISEDMTAFNDSERQIKDRIQFVNLITKCFERCQAPCKTAIYFVKGQRAQFNRTFFGDVANSDGTVPFQVVIHHGDDDDIFLKHSPLMDWLSYLGTVGGLAGMWVDFSFTHFLTRILNWFANSKIETNSLFRKERMSAQRIPNIYRNPALFRHDLLGKRVQRLYLLILFLLCNVLALYLLHFFA